MYGLFARVAHAAVLGRIRADASAGRVVGDYLDKPVAQGGLELSRYTATIALFVLIVVLVLVIPQRAATKAH